MTQTVLLYDPNNARTGKIKFVDVTVTYSSKQELATECNWRKEDLDITGETEKRKKQMAKERCENVVRKARRKTRRGFLRKERWSVGFRLVDTRCTLTEGIDLV